MTTTTFRRRMRTISIFFGRIFSRLMLSHSVDALSVRSTIWPLLFVVMPACGSTLFSDGGK
jgi:hypothetical protein